ncbi:MAG: DNA polymerase III subunit alpha, partial [Pseudomonadota bacterium]|nr:DNA polymerase III subunit alpha [Pseudomonadota bacterium]
MELKNKNHDSFVYKRRLQDELDVINNMGFASYFLIVSDFIDWAKKNNIPVGPGRGSGAGSLVAYVLGITNLDPMEYDLLFERFLNPERVSMPDFDIDFCMEGRDKVIDYVSQKYGSEKVSQIITYGTMAARAVIRDAGRVLDQPYGFVDKIAKQVPFEVGMTLDKALEQDDELRRMYSQDEEVEAIINLAKSLEGLVRNAGKHAGGVVIAPENLTDYTPLYCEEGQINVVTQFDKDDVEAAGLVKFDFLGLRTLTIIDLTLRIVNNSKPMKELNINEIPIDDAKTFELLRSCNTTAVFQLESIGMRDLIKRMKPDQFDDLVALVALFRPGPLQSGMVDDFINRKHDSNNININYLHPDLEVILKETYGVILYQEQVMHIAQTLAVYSLGCADILRRALGKKKIDEMSTQRKIFIDGSIERGVSKDTASYIFDLMEKFAGYGFNKSHSAAYALLSYQTAFLKAHFTPHFLAAVMTTEIDNTDRLIMIKDDCLKYNIELIRPSINSSFYEFTVLSENSILYGLGAIKGIGKSTVELIVSERSAKSYQDLNEFCSRLGMEKINRRVLEALIKSGSMDDFGISRKQLNSQLADAIKSADQGARDIAAGQNDMFGLNEISEEKVNEDTEIQEWEDDLFLKKEKEALGLYLSGHPFNAFKEDALYFTDGDLKTIHSFEPPNLRASEKKYHQPLKDIIVSGLIADIKRRGNRISVILDDNTTRMEAVFFSEVFQLHKGLLKKDQIVVIEGKLRFDDFSSSWQVNVDNVTNIEDMIVQRAKILIIELKNAQEDKSVLSKIKQTLKSSDKGQCLVAINYSSASASGRVDLGDEWMISPTKDVRENLVRLLGEGSLRLNY